MPQLPSLVTFEQPTQYFLDVYTRLMGEDVGCQMLILRSSLVGTIRLPSRREPCACLQVHSPGDWTGTGYPKVLMVTIQLAGRLREKAREASRAPHWPKGGNPYSLLASLGRVSV